MCKKCCCNLQVCVRQLLAVLPSCRTPAKRLLSLKKAGRALGHPARRRGGPRFAAVCGRHSGGGRCKRGGRPHPPTDLIDNASPTLCLTLHPPQSVASPPVTGCAYTAPSGPQTARCAVPLVSGCSRLSPKDRLPCGPRLQRSSRSTADTDHSRVCACNEPASAFTLGKKRKK